MARNLPSTPEAASSERHHPHPVPVAPSFKACDYDVLVVGGGHAGVEAALAAGRLGARVGLISHRLDRIGEMSCNPAIGGLGKGQIVREVDALGGAMGRAIDVTGIQFRMLNTAKGHAVQAPRAQADRHRYREEIARLVREDPTIELIEGGVDALRIRESSRGKSVEGAVLENGRELTARPCSRTVANSPRARPS